MSGLLVFTLTHTAISLFAIAAGFVMVIGMIQSKRFDDWIAAFLWTTTATNVTGFFFPFTGLKPPHVLGVLSLLVLIPAFLAYYRYQLAGPWRRVFVISSIVAFYFNFFVLIAQAFQKIPALNALAPTQTELPFKLAQFLVLAFFVNLGILADKKFHPEIVS